MGLYDTVILDDEIELPEFSGNPQDVNWQTKTIGRPVMRVFKVSNDKRLMRKEQSFRDMTDEEMKEKANKSDYDSWDEWVNDDSSFGPLDSWKNVVDEEWWVDHNRHGSFEIHGSTNTGEKNKIYWSYELRFTDGSIDDIILLSKKDIST